MTTRTRRKFIWLRRKEGRFIFETLKSKNGNILMKDPLGFDTAYFKPESKFRFPLQQVSEETWDYARAAWGQDVKKVKLEFNPFFVRFGEIEGN
ncbi:MAG: hypothetical protein OEX08_02845, partial [Candidatus Nomurabacteria bacterium]|nr:hypothetical protein [Candidatus Nomurabacteria bacterium]